MSGNFAEIIIEGLRFPVSVSDGEILDSAELDGVYDEDLDRAIRALEEREDSIITRRTKEE